MRFTCTKDNLLKGFDMVSGVVRKSVNLPILANTLIEVKENKVELVATDLELATRATIRAKVDAPGSFTVPTKTMSDFIRLLTEEQVTVSLEGNELHIISGTTSTKIKGTPADEFPVFPEIEAEKNYTLLAEPFRQALSDVVIATAKNEIRPELSGVYAGFFTERFGGLVMAATDSYRLAEKKLSVAQGTDQFTAIIPAHTVQEMIRLIGLGEGETQVRISFSGNHLMVRFDTFELSSRLVDGRYPDYAQIIPTEFAASATVSGDMLTKKIKAASLFTTLGVNAVRFEITPEMKSLSLSSISTQKGEHSASVEAVITGEKNDILLNHRYVLDGLSHMSGDIVFEMNSPQSPCLFHEKDKDEYLYIVMPIRQ